MTTETTTADEVIDDPVEFDAEIEFHTTAEYLAGAFNALMAMSETDALTAADHKVKKRIVSRSIKIIDFCIDEYYRELIDETKEDEND